MSEPAELPVKRDRSLTGFYIAVGVVAALFLLGVWLRTPARIAYWEWQARRGGDEPMTQARREAVFNLLWEIGQPAHPALNRLLHSPHQRFRCEVAEFLYFQSQNARKDSPPSEGLYWPLVLALENLQHDDPEVARWAFLSAQEILVRNFADSRALMQWWEREGRAKYETMRRPKGEEAPR